MCKKAAANHFEVAFLKVLQQFMYDILQSYEYFNEHEINRLKTTAIALIKMIIISSIRNKFTKLCKCGFFVNV